MTKQEGPRRGLQKVCHLNLKGGFDRVVLEFIFQILRTRHEDFADKIHLRRGLLLAIWLNYEFEAQLINSYQT